MSLFLSQELGFEEGQSVMLLEKFSTVQAVLTACSDVARGKITSTYCISIFYFKKIKCISQSFFLNILLLKLFLFCSWEPRFISCATRVGNHQSEGSEGFVASLVAKMNVVHHMLYILVVVCHNFIVLWRS